VLSQAARRRPPPLHLALPTRFGNELTAISCDRLRLASATEEAPGIAMNYSPAATYSSWLPRSRSPFLEGRARRALQLGGHISIRGKITPSRRSPKTLLRTRSPHRAHSG